VRRHCAVATLFVEKIHDFAAGVRGRRVPQIRALAAHLDEADLFHSNYVKIRGGIAEFLLDFLRRPCWCDERPGEHAENFGSVASAPSARPVGNATSGAFVRLHHISKIPDIWKDVNSRSSPTFCCQLASYIWETGHLGEPLAITAMVRIRGAKPFCTPRSPACRVFRRLWLRTALVNVPHGEVVVGRRAIGVFPRAGAVESAVCSCGQGRRIDVASELGFSGVELVGVCARVAARQKSAA